MATLTVVGVNPERLPALVADEIDELMLDVQHDPASYRALHAARERLRSISWDRCRNRHEHRDKALRLRRHCRPIRATRL
jgi:hypothetical protein